jgi:hypothetical protein
MNCLSSEDLNEQRNYSLTLEHTLNPHPCLGWRSISISLTGKILGFQSPPTEPTRRRRMLPYGILFQWPFPRVH